MTWFHTHTHTHTHTHIYIHTIILFHLLFKFILFFGHVTYGILVPQPGIKPMSPAVDTQSLNHWTAREVFYSSSFTLWFSTGCWVQFPMLYIGPCLSILYTTVCFLVSILFKAFGSGPSCPISPAWCSCQVACGVSNLLWVSGHCGPLLALVPLPGKLFCNLKTLSCFIEVKISRWRTPSRSRKSWDLGSQSHFQK